jgi:signal transduction histidine kinase
MPLGALLVGINSRLRLDDAYVDFLRLVAAQLAGAVSALELVNSERAARQEAERATRAKDDFLATLSHELRSPLNAIAGWAQILKMDPSNEQRVRVAVEVIERNAEHQVRLISDLLDLSRITSGKIRVAVRAVELAAEVDAVVESVRPQADAKSVRIEVAADRTARVSGDPERIRQMLLNLVVNAVQFTTEGGRVEISVARAVPLVRVVVSDDGEGISPDVLPYVFERFRQADSSTTRRHGGLGLGLALVKQLAELHGGSVRAESAGLGRGATLTLELPMADPTIEIDAREPQETRAGGTLPRVLEGVRVLAVDDHGDALTVLEHLLQDRGVTLRTAVGAEAALAILREEVFDVIVSDIAMPGLDGYELMQRVRQDGVHTPAIALTALAHASDHAKALAAGYQAHVSKPVDTSVLVTTIARLGGRL